ncbi:hypothetical protein PR003_g32246, partial [Phytophthora rubi]
PAPPEEERRGPTTSTDEETKDSEPPDVQMEVAPAEDTTSSSDEWRLQFDGACRSAPNPGGAGAILFDPSGAAAWSCSHYMPGATETNNTAEYTALLLGARAAADHGATRLHIQGDSLLVIRQVKGIYGAKSTRLRGLRNAVRTELARVGNFSLHHIDRQDNGHADRLANRALDQKNTLVECATHPGRNACTTSTAPRPETAAGPPAPPPPTPADITMADAEDHERQADIDDGEVYAPVRLEPGVVPARRPRLRLRHMDEEEFEEAGEMVERLSSALTAKIEGAEDWETAEGYITALPHLLYEKLQQYTQARGQDHRRPPAPSADTRGGGTQAEDRDCAAAGGVEHRAGDGDGRTPVEEDRRQQQPARRRRRRRARRKGRRARRHPRAPGPRQGNQQQRPPRCPRPSPVGDHHRVHRFNEALEALHDLERTRPHDRPAIAKARRRVGRVRSAIDQHMLRHRFDT